MQLLLEAAKLRAACCTYALYTVTADACDISKRMARCPSADRSCNAGMHLFQTSFYLLSRVC